jgi:TatD DNase family protein
MSLFDTHCHIDLYPDPAGVVREIERRGVYTIAVTNTPSVYSPTAALAHGSRYVRSALGLHPQLAAERRGELPLFFEHLPDTRYVGEVGLDYVTSDRGNRTHQRRVFGEILGACHAAGDKVLTVHSRRAEADVVDAVGEGFPGTVILHWYSGSLRILDLAVSRGFYFSVNPAMAGGKRFASILSRIPPERVLLETDGPFVSVGARPAVPVDVETVVVRIAEVWAVPAEQVRDSLFSNFSGILRGHPPEASL